MIRVDASLCDGCDLCVPACPSAAIGRVGARIAPRDGGEVFLACDAVGGPGGVSDAARVACLHAFGLRDLARWGAAGGTRIVVPEVSCDGCPRGGVVALEATVAAFGRLATSRRLTPMRLEVLPIDRWIAAAVDGGAARRPDRRAFFRRLFAGGAAVPPRDGAVARCGAGLALARPGEEPAAGGLVAAAPTFDADRCDGCDACVRLCPRGAWRRDPGGLTLVPTACDGCGVCVDVCDRGALRLDRLVAAEVRHHRLDEVRCRVCGLRFRRAPGASTDLCRICATPGRSDRRDRVIWVGDFGSGGRR